MNTRKTRAVGAALALTIALGAVPALASAQESTASDITTGASISASQSGEQKQRPARPETSDTAADGTAESTRPERPSRRRPETSDTTADGAAESTRPARPSHKRPETSTESTQTTAAEA